MVTYCYNGRTACHYSIDVTVCSIQITGQTVLLKQINSSTSCCCFLAVCYNRKHQVFIVMTRLPERPVYHRGGIYLHRD